MPMPIGGSFALTRVSPAYDPELEDHRLQQRFYQQNLKCILKFFKTVLPPTDGKLEGVIVLEAKEDPVEYHSVFIRMKGLPLDLNPKKKIFKRVPSTVKFSVLENGRFQISKGSRTTYKFNFILPEELPPPLITSEGKLMYRVQVFILTNEDKIVTIGEAPLRWQGSRVLTMEEMYRPVRLQQRLTSKREYLKLGKRKMTQMEWYIEMGGFIPGDAVLATLFGETKEKMGTEVECRLELVQKVRYQIPSSGASSKGGKIFGKLKVNVVATHESIGTIKVGGGEGDDGKKEVWQGELQVPRGLTPTYVYDFLNSVSYTLRLGVIIGERSESWVADEIPVVIGSSREVDEKFDEGEELEKEWAESRLKPGFCLEYEKGGGSTSNLKLEGKTGGRSRSQSVVFISSQNRPWRGSVASMESLQSLASSTLSVMNLPPSEAPSRFGDEPPGRMATLESCKKFLNRLKHDLARSFKMFVFLVPPAYYELDAKEQEKWGERKSSTASRGEGENGGSDECVPGPSTSGYNRSQSAGKFDWKKANDESEKSEEELKYSDFN